MLAITSERWMKMGKRVRNACAVTGAIANNQAHTKLESYLVLTERQP